MKIDVKYCTNCGKESKNKTCEHCGVKMNKTHLFCMWCGSELSENASICPNCKEKTKPLSSIPGVVLAIILFVAALLSDPVVLKILLIALGILFLPFMRRILKQKTVGNQKKRKIISIVTAIVVVVALSAFVKSIGTENGTPTATMPTEKTAIKMAESVFHDNVQLKNEESYVLNDADCTIFNEPYDGDENRVLIRVKLDYSAQNGFGGMNRESYTVEMVYDMLEKKYYEVSKYGDNIYLSPVK
ncbi:MAG: hypothetical protein IJA31_10145 [Clostridia bacterium]|nr:hypothetical protein [Clostridia bacterium]